MAGVKMTDNSGQVKQQMQQNVKAALTAMGVTGVELVNRQMQSGYGKPIRDTGDLMRDVSFEVEASGPDSVDIGNSLNYATPVHEGFNGHPVFIEAIGEFRVLPGGHTAGRPYITDALFNSEAGKALEEVVAEAMKQGFDA